MAQESERETLIRQLAPYRGKLGLVFKDEQAGGLGHSAVYLLWKLCDGSPTGAAEFLGYKVKNTGAAAHMSSRFAMGGLPTKKRDGWVQRRGEEAELAEQQFSAGLSLSDKREAYLAATNRQERAPIYDWRIPPDAEFAQLVTVSDLHYGPPEMDYARWLRMRDWIADNPAVRWVGLGDFLDTAVHDSPGMGGEGQALDFETARELLAQDLEPIRKQCLMLLMGNHEGRIANKLKLKLCPIRDLSRRLEIPYGGTSSYLSLRVKQGKHEQRYDGFLHHGFGSAQTPGGKINKLFKTLEWNAIDFLAMGHTHAQVVVEQLRMGLIGDPFEEDGRQWLRVGARTIPMAFAGSFLKHQAGSYSRDFGLSPASLGAVDFRFHATKKSVHGRV